MCLRRVSIFGDVSMYVVRFFFLSCFVSLEIQIPPPYSYTVAKIDVITTVVGSCFNGKRTTPPYFYIKIK